MIADSSLLSLTLIAVLSCAPGPDRVPPASATGSGQDSPPSPVPDAAPAAAPSPTREAPPPAAEEEQPALTPIARANREKMTNPATGRLYFESDPFDLSSLLPTQFQEGVPARYWELELSPDVRVDAGVLVGKYFVVYVTPDGIWRGPETPFKAGLDGDETHQNMPSVQARTLTFDYDGDGIPELILGLDLGPPSRAGYERRTRIFTAKGGRVSLYAPSAKLSIVIADDIDGDERPDLWLQKKPDWVAARSLPNGTFSTSDPVARKATAER